MSHDKIKAAARERMVRTGESYATARREVIREHQAASRGSDSDIKWFAIRYGKAGFDRLTAFMDGLIGAGPGSAGVEVDGDEIRILMGRWKQRIPRASVRSASRSGANLHGTSGVHVSKGQLLVNGTSEGLVELMLDPPCHTDRTPSTMFVKEKVNSVLISLVDPDGFIATMESDPHTSGS